MQELLNKLFNSVRRLTRPSGMTLVEVLYATAIFSMAVASVISGLYLAQHNAKRSSYDQIATKYANERMEQIRAATWSPNALPVVDELTTTNFPPDTVVIDRPAGAAPPITALRSAAFTTVSVADSNVYKVVEVSVIWNYPRRGTFTNSLVGIRPRD